MLTSVCLPISFVQRCRRVPVTVATRYLTLVQNRYLLLNTLRVACLIIKLAFLHLSNSQGPSLYQSILSLVGLKRDWNSVMTVVVLKKNHSL